MSDNKDNNDNDNKEQNNDEIVVSYADIRGEWEERKISLWGAAKAFITQLRPGQEMTKISIPALFLRPYSMLEEAAARVIGNIDCLETISELNDPSQRMKCIATWLLTSARPENFNHKPYNPVIGEEHKAKFELNDGGRVFFISEQVRHHPPITAFNCVIPSKGVIVSGNSNFSVTFTGNAVTVSMLGELRIRVRLPSGEEEVYRLSKCIPDILLQNVIFGKKHIYWSGDITMDCEETGYSGTVKFVPEKAFNKVTGTIINDKKEVIYYIKGNTGKTLHMASDKKMKENLELIVDYKNVKINIPTYPKRSDLNENSSIRLWGEVTKAIIDNNMEIADEKKEKIESKQRSDYPDQTKFIPKYFKELAENIWEVNDFDWYLSSKDVNPDAE